MSAANALSSDKSAQPTTDARSAEPSMEDILASIRRIIADDQSRHASAGAAAVASRRAPAPPPPLPAPPPGLAERPTFQAGSLSRRTPAPAATIPLPGPSVATATPSGPVEEPVGAPVVPHLNPPAADPVMDFDRLIIDEITSAGVASALRPSDPAPVAETSRPDVPPAAPTSAAADLSPSTAERLPPAVEHHPPGPDRAPPVTVLPEESPVAEPAPATIEVVLATPDKPAAEEPKPAPEPAREASPEPLVSPTADASIESSFNALATSVFLQNTGMVEGMVRDMLRPMLKTWLEDNLPTIVERLVRAEIERVARGGRG